MVRIESAAGVQFENANALRMYPFADSADLSCPGGGDFPAGAVADVRMVVPGRASSAPDGAGSGGPVVRLSSARLSPGMVSVCFVSELPACGGSPARADALSVSVSADAFEPYRPYRMEPLSGSSDIGGVVAFGPDALRREAATYFPADARVHPCCVASRKPAALRRIIDPRSGEWVSGDVSIEFTGAVSASMEGGGFRLSLDPSSRAELATPCAGLGGSIGDPGALGACGATPITSINGVGPDGDGNVLILFRQV